MLGLARVGVWRSSCIVLVGLIGGCDSGMRQRGSAVVRTFDSGGVGTSPVSVSDVDDARTLRIVGDNSPGGYFDIGLPDGVHLLVELGGPDSNVSECRCDVNWLSWWIPGPDDVELTDDEVLFECANAVAWQETCVGCDEEGRPTLFLQHQPGDSPGADACGPLDTVTVDLTADGFR